MQGLTFDGPAAVIGNSLGGGWLSSWRCSGRTSWSVSS